MADKKINPVSGQVYTLAQIFNDLNLPDSPSLCFSYLVKGGVIQTSHVTHAELLAVPGFAESRWRYRYETSEWIPLFMYAGEAPITEFVTIEPWLADFPEAETFWVCPKGHPREQVY